MELEMQQLKVYVGQEGHVVMSQERMWTDAAVIVLHPRQIPILVEWLNQTAIEAALCDADNGEQGRPLESLPQGESPKNAKRDAPTSGGASKRNGT